ncbi:MAG TPA: nucleotidyltransferase domain-containing protein [bacterium]|nr:nucleotidyltransferase domain-containing protein [bacterium]HOL49703.1 nucleotidyltransferase domain-containing protein [bacterium]HPO52407.1 nucleotidyltransferase domain-containing protein [bacterium]
MSNNTIKKEVETFVDQIKKFFEEELISVVIYGSYARGDYLKDLSDINILVLVKEFTSEDFVNFSEMFHKSVASTSISPVIFTPQILENSWDLFPLQWAEIKDQGLVVYGRDFRHEIVVSKQSIRMQLRIDARRFYFTLQSLIVEKNYRMIFETIYRQAKIIQRGLELLDIGRIEFDYLSELENLVGKKYGLFRAGKQVIKFINNHIKMLEKTISILDSKDDMEY